MTVWADLNASDRDVLAAVGILDQPCGQEVRRYLSEEMGWSAVSDQLIYPALSRLNSQELVEVELDPSDPRRHRYELSDDGLDLIERRQRTLDDATPDLITDGGLPRGRHRGRQRLRGLRTPICAFCGRPIEQPEQRCHAKFGGCSVCR